MGVLTCPYCYHEQQSDGLWYVCTGQAAPRRVPCEESLNDVRARITGYALPSMPAFEPAEFRDAQGRAHCTECGALCGGQACARCQTPLPHELSGGSSPLIGMVGRTASGKSVYLTVLHQQLRDVVRKSFDADVTLVGDQQSGSNTVQEWLDGNHKAIYDDHRLLRPTDPDPIGRRVPLVVAFRYVRDRGRWRRPAEKRVLLSFCDVAGEDLLTQPRAARQPYLSAADGLIVLLDAWQIPRVREELGASEEEAHPLVDGALGVVTETLRTARGPGVTGPLTVPIAVVVSKFDVVETLLPDNDYLRTAEPVLGAGYDEVYGDNVHERVRTFLDKFGADDVDVHMRRNYAGFRYFAVSSLGAPPVLDGGRQMVDAGGPRPKNVEQPLLWLLNQQKIIPSVRR